MVPVSFDVDDMGAGPVRLVSVAYLERLLVPTLVLLWPLAWALDGFRLTLLWVPRLHCFIAGRGAQAVSPARLRRSAGN
ncbi:hypothetical protein JCM16814_17160 [Desulfobaculum senezii]